MRPRSLRFLLNSKNLWSSKVDQASSSGKEILETEIHTAEKIATLQKQAAGILWVPVTLEH